MLQDLLITVSCKSLEQNEKQKKKKQLRTEEASRTTAGQWGCPITAQKHGFVFTFHKKRGCMSCSAYNIQECRAGILVLCYKTHITCSSPAVYQVLSQEITECHFISFCNPIQFLKVQLCIQCKYTCAYRFNHNANFSATFAHCGLLENNIYIIYYIQRYMYVCSL